MIFPVIPAPVSPIACMLSARDTFTVGYTILSATDMVDILAFPACTQPAGKLDDIIFQ